MPPEIRSIAMFDKTIEIEDSDQQKKTTALVNPVASFIVDEFPVNMTFVICFCISRLQPSTEYLFNWQVRGPGGQGVSVGEGFFKTAVTGEHPRIPPIISVLIRITIDFIEEGEHAFLVEMEGAELVAFPFPVFRKVNP